MPFREDTVGSNDPKPRWVRILSGEMKWRNFAPLREFLTVPGSFGR